MSQYPDQKFAERLSRIQQAAPPKAQKRRGQKSREMAHNAIYPLSFVGAFALGVVMVFVLQFVRYQLNPNSIHSDTFVLDAVFAMAGVWALGIMFRLKEKEFRAAQGVGVFVTISLIHNLAFWAPDTMETVFNENWVAVREEVATPNSLMLMGTYIPFKPDAPNGSRGSDRKLPKVTYH